MSEAGDASPGRQSHRTGATLYWAFAALLFGFGSLALLSVGPPFLLLGLTLVSLWPVRHRPRVFWPVLVGVTGFLLAAAMLVPLGCSTAIQGSVEVPPLASMTPGQRIEAPGPAAQTARTTCSNAVGITYAGRGGYSPPLWPAALAGLAGGTMAGGATAALVRRITR